MELEVNDMTCRSCVGTVARTLQRVPGVSAVEVDLMRGMARVETDLFGAEVPAMVAALAAAGFGARPVATAAAPNVDAVGIPVPWPARGTTTITGGFARSTQSSQQASPISVMRSSA
ncbi:MAG TPA: heavy metal-associated domain-containing protein [Gemmatimonadaceae bacterium]